MHFIWPFMLWLLLLIPALIFAYIGAQRRRHKYALRYASLSLVKEAMGKGPGIRRHIPPTLFLLGLTVMILALARPFTLIKLPAQEGTVILTIDVSGSMAADDVKPTRMEAAKEAARTFIENEPDGVQVGVVSFTDNAFVIQAPTSDREAVIGAINRLSPQRGTAIGDGIMTSLSAILDKPGGNLAGPGGLPTTGGLGAPASGSANSALIVLLTDGENNQGVDPLDAAQQARDQGIRIYTVGIGSKEGTVLHIRGRAIKTYLDEATLQKVADLTHAQYFNASNEGDLRSIYENLSTRLTLKTERTEVTASFTAVAAVLSLLAGFLSLLWFNRLP